MIKEIIGSELQNKEISIGKEGNCIALGISSDGKYFAIAIDKEIHFVQCNRNNYKV